MLIGVPKETWPGELRAALVPADAKTLVAMGFDVVVESSLGVAAGLTDAAYVDAGARVEMGPGVTSGADVVLRVRKPRQEDVSQVKSGALHLSFLDPFNEKALVEALAQQGVTAVSMEMIPRISRAQKMDALSSQANLAGYVTVIMAAHQCPKIFPMMMTPAGTIRPARVFIIGAGVSGLQAIATAQRLGARVEAFDTRPAVAEQVQSLGAKFVDIDIGEVGQTEQGYAKALTDEQLEMQRQGMADVIRQADVLITTAAVFGRPAPRIVTHDMVASMQPGSVVVDLAVESGGNVEGSVLNEIVNVNGVMLMGMGNLPSNVARNASEMYSANLTHFLDNFWNEDSKTLELDPDDDIARGCVLTRDGAVVNETIKNL
ncbi:MAG: Re/Si-specific NAD(P)(+) transhydrogenase subunit alpha [Gammaproteobacteria bacterium]|nr:Re/Si-specific NAD(P)(+) transhydrogenase subunit alpha [Gammaproteobacteria bacterium]